MTEQLDIIIVSGGQGGLSTSYHLLQQGREHVILEQADQVAEAWRNRWDSFALITPNWMVRLPRRYRGKDIARWSEEIGFADRTVDKLPSPKAKFAGSAHGTGKDGGHTINLHQFAREWCY